MKKLIKIFIVIVMLFSVYLIHPNAATDNSKGGKTTTTTTTTQSNNNGPEKGDLRCPVNVSGCKETKDRSGKVIETEVTETKEGVTVTKYVRKTDTPGEVEVQFKMSGSGSVTASSKAYVVLVMDASSTMTEYYKSKVIPAARSFANKIVNPTNNSSNIYLAFVAYNSRVSAYRNFSNANFDSADFGSVAVGSHIQYGFAKANEFFAKVTGRKYVVIFSDGKFRSREDDPFGAAWQTLRDTTDVRYSIDFVPPGGGSKSQYRNNLRAFVKEPGKYYYLKTDYNYNAIFEEVAIDIHEDIEETCISGTVVDTIGPKFSIIDGRGRKVFLEFDKVTSDGVLSKPFKIKIDKSVKTNWYSTNTNFKFNVGGGKNYTVKINPQIYWERESKELLSCSDKQQFSESDSKNEQYYSIKCYQGWGKKVGYSAELKINGEDLNTKKIFLNRGEGFSANLKLVSHLKCNYKFDYEAFNNRIQEINNLLNDSNITKKEKKALRKELNDGNDSLLGTGGILDTYIELTKNRSTLKSEKEKFINQTAVLKVSYLNSTDYDKMNLENVSLGGEDIDCTEKNKQTINGKEIFAECSCNVTLSKTMSLPKTCLSMETGEQEDCLTNSNTQISGGNLFYPRLDSTGGYISLSIKNAGYFRNDITLDGDETDNNVRRCEFSLGEEILSSSNSMYRQIELSDPFLKTYTKKRITGRNWNNKKYNFEEVIDKNTWNDTYQFKYVISKSNVNNIIKDTISSNERVNSYLGSDCYFTKNNKYVCSLTRNKASDGVTWFSKVYIND